MRTTLFRARPTLFRARRGVRTGLIVAASVLAVGALGACGDNGDNAPGDNASGTDASAPTTHSVAHDAGTTDNVPAQPKKIVSLSVTLTGHLLALDAPVIATQASPGPFSDPSGYFLQWAEVAKKRNVQVVYSGTEVNLEKIIALQPDLIIGAASGADSVAKQYDALKAIAPTLIYRYDNLSWSDLTRKLGEAIGRKEKATGALADFDARVARVKAAIKAPTQEVAPIRNNDTEIVVFTDRSAQGQLLASLGFKLRAVPDNLKKGVGNEGARVDIVTVAQENVPPALGDAGLLFVGHRPEQITAAQAKPLWSALPAVTTKRVYDLGLDSFRLDYFSASAILDRVEKSFA